MNLAQIGDQGSVKESCCNVAKKGVASWILLTHRRTGDVLKADFNFDISCADENISCDKYEIQAHDTVCASGNPKERSHILYLGNTGDQFTGRGGVLQKDPENDSYRATGMFWSNGIKATVDVTYSLPVSGVENPLVKNMGCQPASVLTKTFYSEVSGTVKLWQKGVSDRKYSVSINPMNLAQIGQFGSAKRGCCGDDKLGVASWITLTNNRDPTDIINADFNFDIVCAGNNPQREEEYAKKCAAKCVLATNYDYVEEKRRSLRRQGARYGVTTFKSHPWQVRAGDRHVLDNFVVGDNDCAANLRSTTWHTTSTFTFHNTGKREMVLHWVNYQGGTKIYSRIQPGQKVYQQTYQSHPWFVTIDDRKILQWTAGANHVDFRSAGRNRHVVQFD